MALKVETARGAMTGTRYIESLRDGREVWLDGAKVPDVTTHPARAWSTNWRAFTTCSTPNSTGMK